ncbi:MAG: hypothetical protein FWE21_04830 [Defluviitaleaceae bacterium]|nr:hypothetical protein [Defluviitaleaceae bacterium]
MVLLVVSRIWWGLAMYISVAIISLLISAFTLKNAEFICPKCGHRDWFILRKQKRVSEAENNG